MSDDILEHYGKKGMKWGVRKARSAGSRIQKARIKNTKALARRDAQIFRKLGLKRMAKDADKVAKTGKQPMMSPSLKKAFKTKVSSLNTPQNKKRMNDGRKLVTQMLKTAGKQKAQSLITKAVSDAVDVGIAKAKG